MELPPGSCWTTILVHSSAKNRTHQRPLPEFAKTICPKVVPASKKTGNEAVGKVPQPLIDLEQLGYGLEQLPQKKEELES